MQAEDLLEDQYSKIGPIEDHIQKKNLVEKDNNVLKLLFSDTVKLSDFESENDAEDDDVDRIVKNKEVHELYLLETKFPKANKNFDITIGSMKQSRIVNALHDKILLDIGKEQQENYLQTDGFNYIVKETRKQRQKFENKMGLDLFK